MFYFESLRLLAIASIQASRYVVKVSLVSVYIDTVCKITIATKHSHVTHLAMIVKGRV